MKLKLISSFLFNIFLIQQSLTQVPPVVPLTNALTAVYCHKSDGPGIMTIRCGPNEKIRMLDAFDATAKNQSNLPVQCQQEQQFSRNFSSSSSSGMDCKVHTSFTSACSGRENCTLHMQRIRLTSVNDNCHNEFIDYTMAFFECISDVFIHNVCSSQAITSAWGTLQTPNFPNPYTSSDDCWCKLSTQVQHRLLLSIIVFQLIPYDQHCAGAGLYLHSSNEQRSTQCTYLQQGHNFLSDNNTLYINFYSRIPTVRGGFWLIYEASHPKAEVHLHCGSRDKIGIPSSLNSTSPSSFSTPFDHGWSRLAFNNQSNSTTPINNPMMRSHLSLTTPYSLLNTNSKINTSTAIGAFSYPHGALTTFQVAYGPRGWFLKHPYESINKNITNFIRLTTPRLPIIKWNFTWRYTRPQRTKLSTIISSPMITTELTTATTITTEQTTIAISTTQTATPQQRLLFTHKPWIYHNFSGSRLLPTTTASNPVIKTTTQPSALSSTLKTSVPVPTPWYSPAGPFDWWQWQWYTTKDHKSSRKMHLPKSTTNTTIVAATTTATTPIRLTNRTTTTPTSTKSQATISLFKWPDQTTVPTEKETTTIDEFAEEYKNWMEYFTSHKIDEIITSTSISPTYPTREQYQQMGYSPTNSNSKIVTINTPPVKRQHTQQNSVVSERNAVATSTNEPVTASNVHNMIRRVIEQRNRKHAMEYGWLSKTDMTIVAVSILFVILLAIINLILFAVRRHRHRLQGRHLLSTSISSTLDDRRRGGNGGHLHSSTFGDATNSLINVTNTNNNDILPAVGEIVIWDEKDQGGYMIDNNGAWAKIEGRQWFGSNIFKSCSKTSLSKSFRSRFRFIRHLDKKSTNHHQHQAPVAPKTPQQAFKFPLLMDTATLSPVPEAEDYESSELSLSDVVIRSSTTTINHSNKRQQLIKSERRHDLQQTTKTIQALIHAEQQQQQNDDDYYKRVGNNVDDSNYAGMPGHNTGASSIGDQETDRSLGNEIDAGGPVVVSVPTMIRRDNDNGMTTDGNDSIHNPNYSIQSLVEYTHPSYLQPNNHPGLFSNKPSISTFKPPPITTTNSMIVGFCQTEFQPLDPKLLFKSNENQPFYRCSQSVQLTTYDSGFIDDQAVESSTTANPISNSEENLLNEQKDEQTNMDDILLTKSEDDDEEEEEDDDQLPENGLTTNEIRNSNRQKWKAVAKRVSFQEEHVTQRFSPPPSSFNTITNPDTSSNLFDTYDVSPDLIQSTSPQFKPSLPTSSSIFTVQKQTTSIDIEDNTQNIIMNHLHSVKSLKKFFETKMVVQQPTSSPIIAPSQLIDEQKLDRLSMNKEQKSTEELDQRQEMMDKVLESLKKTKAYSRTTNDTPEPSGRCSAITTSSYDSNLTQNLAVQRHYSRRFRSSSTSNNSLYPSGNIVTHINLANAQHNKRAYSQDRQHYQTTDHHHHLSNIDKWKQEQQQRQIDSDEEDNISENSMLWQARTKLNEFVTRSKKNHRQSSPYYTTCANGGIPSEDIYIYDDNESVTAETRF